MTWAGINQKRRQIRKPESVMEKIPQQNKGLASQHAAKMFQVNGPQADRSMNGGFQDG